jgi:hypothetical protein
VVVLAHVKAAPLPSATAGTEAVAVAASVGNLGNVDRAIEARRSLVVVPFLVVGLEDCRDRCVRGGRRTAVWS